MSQPYLSLEAELHDAFWEVEDDGSEVGLMADFLSLYPGTALEIGAGSGRLMLPLVQQGFSVEGLELSEDMLKMGQRRAEELGLSACLHQGDMSIWNGGKIYEALLAPAFTFQLATDPASTLEHWKTLLRPGGGLYLSVFMPFAELLGDRPEHTWYEDHQVTLADGRVGLLETRHRLDMEQQIVVRQHRYTISGDAPLHHASEQKVRWFDPHQLSELLENAGFRVTRFFLDFDSSHICEDPDSEDYDGILTFHAERV